MRTEPPSFEELVNPHLERLFRLAYRLAGQVADAEDLLQDVLVSLYERRDELTSIENPGPWLSRVLYNRFVDGHRRLARRRLRVVGSAVAGDGTAADKLESLACPDPGPAALTETGLHITRLTAALNALSLEQRSVLLMHDAEGYKLSEIQQITGVPVGTLKSRLHRARARVRALLGEMEPFAPGERVAGVERS